MGGINPPPHTVSSSMDGFQKGFTQGIWNIAVPFFQAHSKLEDACLTELNSGVPDYTAISAAQTYASSVLSATSSEISLTNSNISVINASPMDRNNYFLFLQLPLLYSLQAGASQLVNALGAPSVTAAAAGLTLQSSMAGKGSNFKIRTQSIQFVKDYIELLQNHVAAVELWNSV